MYSIVARKHHSYPLLVFGAVGCFDVTLAHFLQIRTPHWSAFSLKLFWNVSFCSRDQKKKSRSKVRERLFKNEKRQLYRPSGHFFLLSIDRSKFLPSRIVCFLRTLEKKSGDSYQKTLFLEVASGTTCKWKETQSATEF